jgi:hypothetical protein
MPQLLDYLDTACTCVIIMNQKAQDALVKWWAGMIEGARKTKGAAGFEPVLT